MYFICILGQNSEEGTHKVILTEKLRNKTVLNHHPSSYHDVTNNMKVVCWLKWSILCVCVHLEVLTFQQLSVMYFTLYHWYI